MLRAGCVLGLVCGAALGAASDAIYPRYAAAIADVPAEEREEVLAQEQLKDLSYHSFDQIPIHDIEYDRSGHKKHHPGVNRITFQGRLNVVRCKRDSCGHCPSGECPCDFDGPGEHPGHGHGGNGHGGHGHGGHGYDGGYGDSVQDADSDNFGGFGDDAEDDSSFVDEDALDAEERGFGGGYGGGHGCKKRKCLTGRYLDVKGVLKRVRYGEPYGQDENGRYLVDEDDEEDEPTERGFSFYKKYYPFSKYHKPKPPPKCTEEFALEKFEVTGGFIQYKTDCFRKLDYCTAPNCTRNCYVKLDCDHHGPGEPCDNDFDLSMVIDDSKTMGQERLDAIVKPIALSVVDSVDPGFPRVTLGLADMDEEVDVVFATGEKHKRADIKQHIREMQVTRKPLSLVDIAEQVATKIGPATLENRRPGTTLPVMLIMLHGNYVHPRDEKAFTQALREIYDRPDPVLPICLLVDNSSPPITEDVARFCGCESPMSCPNLVYIDGDDPEMIVRVARRIRQRICRARRHKAHKPFYGAGVGPSVDDAGLPDGQGEGGAYFEVSDSKGHPHYVPAGGRGDDAVDEDSADGSIHAASTVSADGLMSDERFGATYDPYDGYYYGKSKKYKGGYGYPGYGYPYNPGYGGYGQGPPYGGYPYGYGPEYGYNPAANEKTYKKTFDTKNGEYTMGLTTKTVNQGSLFNKNLFNKGGHPPPPPPQPYPTHFPEQAPCMTMQTNGVTYDKVEKSIGFDAFFSGVRRKMSQTYKVPPQNMYFCCAQPAPPQPPPSGQTQFLGASISGGITYKAFFLDVDKCQPQPPCPLPQKCPPPTPCPAPMECAHNFRNLVGKDFSESNALGPYLSPRTNVTDLAMTEVAPYTEKLTEAVAGQEDLVNRGAKCGGYYCPPPPPPPGSQTQLAYKVLNINLTLCMYYLKRGTSINNQCYYKGKSAGECYLARALTQGGAGECEPFTMQDTTGLDADVVGALRELETLSHDETALEALVREGGEALSLFDLGGGLPEPLNLGAIRQAGGHPTFNLCPSNNHALYKRPIRDAMRNLSKATGL